MAAGKAPMQISTEGAGIPQKAIDGSTSSFFSAETCSLTKSERVPWWYVNLLEPYMVQLVRLDFGKSCCGKWNRNVLNHHPAWIRMSRTWDNNFLLYPKLLRVARAKDEDAPKKEKEEKKQKQWEKTFSDSILLFDVFMFKVHMQINSKPQRIINA